MVGHVSRITGLCCYSHLQLASRLAHGRSVVTNNSNPIPSLTYFLPNVRTLTIYSKFRHG